jgi:hypothetical protein
MHAQPTGPFQGGTIYPEEERGRKDSSEPAEGLTRGPDSRDPRTHTGTRAFSHPFFPSLPFPCLPFPSLPFSSQAAPPVFGAEITQAPKDEGIPPQAYQAATVTTDDPKMIPVTHRNRWAKSNPGSGSPIQREPTPGTPPRRMQANRPQVPSPPQGRARAALQSPTPPHETGHRGRKWWNERAAPLVARMEGQSVGNHVQSKREEKERRNQQGQTAGRNKSETRSREPTEYG